MGFKLDGPGGAVPLLHLNYSPDTSPLPGEGLSFEQCSSGIIPPTGSGGGLVSPSADESGFGPGHREVGAAYLRLSTPGQEDGTSFAKQHEAVMVSASHWDVFLPSDHIIQETASGADFGRLGLRALESLIEKGLVKHVFLFSPDRLARDPYQLLQFLRLCKNYGVLVHFADGSRVETIFDEMIQYMKGLFGYVEREQTSQRTQDGKRRVAKQGRMPHGVGRGIYGYDYDPVTKTRSINEAEATVVRELFQRALGGVSSNVMSKDLQTRGITTKTGSRFDARKIYHILRNETYTGSHWWGRHRFEKMPTTPHGPKRRVTLQPPERWIRMTKFSPQIITPYLWAAVQQAMNSRRRPGPLWDYQFSGFFSCAECGSNIVGATIQYRGQKYPYYRCSGTVARDGQPRICSLKAYRAGDLEPLLWEHIYEAVENPTLIFDEIRANVSGPSDAVDRQVFELERSINKGIL